MLGPRPCPYRGFLEGRDPFIICLMVMRLLVSETKLGSSPSFGASSAMGGGRGGALLLPFYA